MTVKIADYPDFGKWTKKTGDVRYPCQDSQHYPPNNMNWAPGIYEHTCPSCGEVTRFTIYPVMS